MDYRSMCDNVQNLLIILHVLKAQLIYKPGYLTIDHPSLFLPIFFHFNYQKCITKKLKNEEFLSLLGVVFVLFWLCIFSIPHLKYLSMPKTNKTTLKIFILAYYF